MEDFGRMGTAGWRTWGQEDGGHGEDGDSQDSQTLGTKFKVQMLGPQKLGV